MHDAFSHPGSTELDIDLEERYHRLVERAPDGILIHDGEKITMANLAAVELAGAHNENELVGLAIETFLNPPFLKGLDGILANPVPGARMPAVRDTFRRIDGTLVQVEVTAIPFVDRGRPAAHLVIRDITERIAAQVLVHQADERIRQAEKMEAVGLLAGGVAHEVNNMMVVVLGFSELLLRDPRLPEGLMDDIRQIRTAGDRAAAITGQLLAFSRRAFHQPESLPLDAAVSDIEATARLLLGENFTLRVSLNCPRNVLLDKGHLHQALVNLTLNARDAMAKGGTFTITTSVVSVQPKTLIDAGSEIPGGEYGLITIGDSGVGMNPAALSHIFEPFYTTKPLGKGTGLGLAAVYGIIKQNKGYLRVASEPDNGTIFSLYLPLSAAGSAVERRRAPRLLSESSPSGIWVLLVDDEPAVLSISARVLERHGYHVLQAADGAVALKMIASQGAPNVVVTDLMMPGIGGVELARRLNLDLPALPIVFMSGFSAEDLQRKGTIDRSVTILQKPFTPDMLIATVESALSQAGVSGRRTE
ncbi:MAG: response regulator [Gemmatimonadota bacterium]